MGMIMGNGDPPGIKSCKGRKKIVKVERVNFPGVRGRGLADVRGKTGRVGWCSGGG